MAQDAARELGQHMFQLISERIKSGPNPEESEVDDNGNDEA
jgi:hypothetical protein